MTGDGLPMGNLSIVLAVLGTFFGILLMLELGRRVGRRGMARSGSTTPTKSAVDGAVFALLGLLIAFTFSGAASRFDHRRLQIADEANEIGTTYLRIDLLPPEHQPGLRDLFRRYVDSRLETYRRLPDIPAALVELKHSQELQHEIWTRAVAACEERDDPAVRTLVLTSLNRMIDMLTTRTMAARVHPPAIVYFLLSVMTLAASFLAGHAMADHPGRPWVHKIGFALVLSLVTYAIIDIEHPRGGFIRISDADGVLVELRQEMDQH